MCPQIPGGPAGLVFTDLDGTLLDHETYDYEPARPALDALGEAAVPLVLCSSKTRGEILGLQRRLGLTGPFIPENGGAVLLTGGGPLEPVFPERFAGLPARVFGAAYGELREALGELRGRYGQGLRGFGDMDDAEVSSCTGLPLRQARLARQRDFDEPFLWEPEPAPRSVEEARSWLAGRGLGLTRGGRFWHLVGPSDKGRAVRWLLDAAARTWGREIASLALGDSENDLPMLREAGDGVLVERPGGGHLTPRPPGVRTVEGVGPRGWCRAVLEWLESVRC
ncbi:MAG: HAD hydrolase family protein [Deferrisomatales bacterium]|nr:HAD hydrolase family protein [Deferrisomatales bacterium]